MRNVRAIQGQLGQPSVAAHPGAEPATPPPSDPSRHATLAQHVLESHPYAIVVARRNGTAVMHNPAAKQLLGELAERLDDPEDPVLCEILGCADREDSAREGLSLITRALEEREALPEVRLDLPAGAAAPAAWVTVAPLYGSDECVIAELRPGRANDRRRRTTPHWTEGPRLRIYALGRTRIESAEGPFGGQWLENRAGQVLKYLVARRDRVVYPDELVETLWEDARMRKVPGVRYYIHQLREQLEPNRSGRGQSSFISRLHGGYTLRHESVIVDVDEFEQHVEAGLAAAAAGDAQRACTELERGLALYGGDFLADEPYAEWAIAERERLRRVAADGLRALADVRLAQDDLTGATAELERLAELEPYDPEVHRRLIALALRRGRRTEAVRRYNALRRRMIATFGEDLDFTLADIASG